MKPPTTLFRRIAAVVIIAVVIGGVLTVAPSGVFAPSSAQSDGATTPTPSGSPSDPYDCGDFDNAQQVRAVFDPNNDESNLDADDDNIPCEGDFPDQSGPVTNTPTDTATATATTTPTPTTTSTETETPTETETETPAATETTTSEQTETPTPTETATPTPTATETAQQNVSENAGNETNTNTSYYQVDFIAGKPITTLRRNGEGTYTPDQLIRFAHGDNDNDITRVSDGEFTTNDTLANRIDSQNITIRRGTITTSNDTPENDTATITFTVKKGEPLKLTLVSYRKVGPGWSPKTEAQQAFIYSQTNTFSAGTHTLKVDLPDRTKSY